MIVVGRADRTPLFIIQPTLPALPDGDALFSLLHGGSVLVRSPSISTLSSCLNRAVCHGAVAVEVARRPKLLIVTALCDC